MPVGAWKHGKDKKHVRDRKERRAGKGKGTDGFELRAEADVEHASKVKHPEKEEEHRDEGQLGNGLWRAAGEEWKKRQD
jgi:hypothetical protein